MGPFPHDAPPAAITAGNPMGTDGFAFVEFAHPEPLQLHRLFRLMGFAKVARHRSKTITVYRQGDVDYLVNEEPNTHAARFAVLHGPCAASMGFRVVDAAHAHQRALSLGAEPPDPEQGSQVLEVPAIKGIGGSLLYLVDRYGAKGSGYDDGFAWFGGRDAKPERRGLYYLDHLTHNVGRGRMDVWAGFYERLFNFRQIRYLDIKGTRACSRVRSPAQMAKSAFRSTNQPTSTARLRNTCIATRAKASSMSPAAAATSSPQSKHCVRTASLSCRRHRPLTTSASTSACLAMERTWHGSSVTAFS